MKAKSGRNIINCFACFLSILFIFSLGFGIASGDSPSNIRFNSSLNLEVNIAAGRIASKPPITTKGEEDIKGNIAKISAADQKYAKEKCHCKDVEQEAQSVGENFFVYFCIVSAFVPLPGAQSKKPRTGLHVNPTNGQRQCVFVKEFKEREYYDNELKALELISAQHNKWLTTRGPREHRIIRMLSKDQKTNRIVLPMMGISLGDVWDLTVRWIEKRPMVLYEFLFNVFTEVFAALEQLNEVALHGDPNMSNFVFGPDFWFFSAESVQGLDEGELRKRLRQPFHLTLIDFGYSTLNKGFTASQLDQFQRFDTKVVFVRIVEDMVRPTNIAEQDFDRDMFSATLQKFQAAAVGNKYASSLVKLLNKYLEFLDGKLRVNIFPIPAQAVKMLWEDHKGPLEGLFHIGSCDCEYRAGSECWCVANLRSFPEKRSFAGVYNMNITRQQQQQQKEGVVALREVTHNGEALIFTKKPNWPANQNTAKTEEICEQKQTRKDHFRCFYIQDLGKKHGSGEKDKGEKLVGTLTMAIVRSDNGERLTTKGRDIALFRFYLK